MGVRALSPPVRLRCWVAIGLAAGVLAPAGAAASTVSLDLATNSVTLVGGPEDNHVSTGGGLFGTMITDSAGIVPGPGCEASSDTQVSCGRYAVINADLGAGNDWIGTTLGPGTMGVVHGGPGNDTIYGDGGNSQLYGDDGNDVVYGSYGDDTVDGGPGFDQIFGDGDYAEPGDDGSDLINARDAAPDDVRCGYGWDKVTADPADRVGDECDEVDRGTAPAPTAMSVRLSAPGRVKIRSVLASGYVFKCAFGASGVFRTDMVLPKSQARRLHLGKRDLTLSKVQGKVDSGWYRVRLRIANKRYRAALRRAKSVTVYVVAAAVDKAGKSDGASKTVRLVR
ncbi:MAG: calcium-binding protein [Solirubrobacteraceae bacterium]